MRVEARPPTGQGHIVGARGFATQSGSVTICQITKIENNFQAQERDRQSVRERGGERASAACAEIRFLSWFWCHCLLHHQRQPCTTSFHTQALEPERAAAPPPPLLIYLPPSPPEPCYVYIQCGLISKLFLPAPSVCLRVCLAEANKAITSARTSQD